MAEKHFLGRPLAEVIYHAEQAGLDAIQRRLDAGLPVTGLDTHGRIVEITIDNAEQYLNDSTNGKNYEDAWRSRLGKIKMQRAIASATRTKFEPPHEEKRDKE
ncbi:hypothetical protein [Chromobacterium violaceum]|uniref:hypothetical protein n=1 Tax=Chromobacterium violaceum TaxID=536 RepID=UPI0015930F6A|nr:hypothetical protein [Chromobacterium violaceum]